MKIDCEFMPEETKTLNVRLLKAGFPNRTVFVLGSTGSGKTTLMANLISALPRFVLFDTRNEYSEFFFTAPVKVANNLNELIDALNAADERIIFKLPGAQNQDQILEAALAVIYQFQFQNKDEENLPPLTVVLDELNLFADTTSYPPTLQDMVQRGRDFKIEKLFGAQWFNTIPTWLRDSFSEIYCFRHSDPNGVKMLERFGFDPDEIKNLPLHVCVHTGKNGVEKIRLVAVAERSTQN